MLAALWIAFAILGSTGVSLLSRVVLKDHFSLPFSASSNLVAAAFFFPFAFFARTAAPSVSFPWFLLLLACAMWTLATFSSASSYRTTDISVRAPLSQSRLLWTLLLGIVILGETISFYRTLGVLIIFAGVFLLVWHPERKFGSFRNVGVQLTLSYAFLTAITAVIDKAVLGYFSPEFYGLVAFLVPGLFLLALNIRRRGELRRLWAGHAGRLVAIGFMTAISYYGMLKAYQMFEVSFVYPFFQLSVVLTGLAGIVFLKEREHLWQKIAATLVVVAGSVVLKLG